MARIRLVTGVRAGSPRAGDAEIGTSRQAQPVSEDEAAAAPPIAGLPPVRRSAPFKSADALLFTSADAPPFTSAARRLLHISIADSTFLLRSRATLARTYVLKHICWHALTSVTRLYRGRVTRSVTPFVTRL